MSADRHEQRGSTAIAAGVLLEPIENVSLKRVAWAFGCAKKGSDEERQLLALLWRVIGRECSGGAIPVPCERIDHSAVER